MKDRYIKDDPFLGVTSPKKVEQSKDYLTIEEINRLISTQCSRKSVKQSFLFSCFTGLRISDIRNLQWGNLQEMNEDRVQIRFKQKKTKSETFVPLDNNAKMFLPERNDAKDTDYIFRLPPGNTVNINLQKWVKDSGIHKHISYHCSRHSDNCFQL